jgi:hypothetical protein
VLINSKDKTTCQQLVIQFGWCNMVFVAESTIDNTLFAAWDWLLQVVVVGEDHCAVVHFEGIILTVLNVLYAAKCWMIWSMKVSNEGG